MLLFLDSLRSGLTCLASGIDTVDLTGVKKKEVEVEDEDWRGKGGILP